ncbi:hypothetical protein [Streptomyces sp. NPDC031705]|uniref:hypothetical protein n=1 Tax=Streptomyces sp. NPDC031705 TaxID=3155729 RepID=UPI003403381B
MSRSGRDGRPRGRVGGDEVVQQDRVPGVRDIGGGREDRCGGGRPVLGGHQGGFSGAVAVFGGVRVCCGKAGQYRLPAGEQLLGGGAARLLGTRP